ncbi:MAG TPA: methyltransferase domain-containing protein [Kamptonema sp.]|nr:methyltransferase domain-containing protein [Kamptonema sp.]
MFTWNPQDYAKNSSAQLSWAREQITKLNLSGSESILDVGCGDGKITAELSRLLQNGYILGIDSSSEMISFAQSTFPQQEFPNLQFACMDARNIAVNREFDLVFSNAALHWLDDHLSFLRSANRVMRKKGRLFTSCGGKGNASDVIRVLNLMLKQKAWADYFKDFQTPWHFYDIPEYNDWLQQAGFEVVNIDLVPKDTLHSGKEGLAAWIRTTAMPYTNCVEESKRQLFIEEFVNLYLSDYPIDENGNSHVNMVRLEVNAIKA